MISAEGGTRVEDGLLQVAERARAAFKEAAPAVLRRWAETDDPRFAKAAELLEREGAPAAP
jgi:hypothetical protein